MPNRLNGGNKTKAISRADKVTILQVMLDNKEDFTSAKNQAETRGFFEIVTSAVDRQFGIKLEGDEIRKKIHRGVCSERRNALVRTEPTSELETLIDKWNDVVCQNSKHELSRVDDAYADVACAAAAKKLDEVHKTLLDPDATKQSWQAAELVVAAALMAEEPGFLDTYDKNKLRTFLRNSRPLQNEYAKQVRDMRLLLSKMEGKEEDGSKISSLPQDKSTSGPGNSRPSQPPDTTIDLTVDPEEELLDEDRRPERPTPAPAPSPPPAAQPPRALTPAVSSHTLVPRSSAKRPPKAPKPAAELGTQCTPIQIPHMPGQPPHTPAQAPRMPRQASRSIPPRTPTPGLSTHVPVYSIDDSSDSASQASDEEPREKRDTKRKRNIEATDSEDEESDQKSPPTKRLDKGKRRADEFLQEECPKTEGQKTLEKTLSILQLVKKQGKKRKDDDSKGKGKDDKEEDKNDKDNDKDDKGEDEGLNYEDKADSDKDEKPKRTIPFNRNNRTVNRRLRRQKQKAKAMKKNLEALQS